MIIRMICVVGEFGDAAPSRCAGRCARGQRVAERAYFAHAMRDEEIVTPCCFSPRDDAAEPVDIAARSVEVGSSSSRMRGAAEEGAGDLDLLLNGEIEIADLARRSMSRPRLDEMLATPRASAARRLIMPVRPDGP